MALRKLLPALAGAFALFALFAFPAAAQSSLPPTPPVKLAVNPVTDKVYMANDDANTVTAFDAVSGTSTTIAVGAGPRFIAVNPVTNRVYVDNADDATLSVIDGATDTLIDTYNIGSSGPITVNPITNVVYVVRMTGLGSDEVTFFNGDTDTWYTIATNSFQPNAMAVDPVTDTIYVTHYGTGDVRVIGGAFDPANDFPDSVSIGTGPHPYAIAFNPVTRKGYVITQDASSPIMVIDGADNSAVFPAVASGHGSGPQAVAVNPVTNRVYAAFSGEVVVIDGATNALTYVPIAGADTGAIALGIDYERNRIYAAASSGVLSVIDGDTDTVVRTDSIPAGTSVAALDPLTATAYFFDTTLTSLPLDGTPHAMPITASITPLEGDTSPGSGSITIDAASTFSPAALPIRGVYFRLDSQDGPWSLASGSGPWTASFSGLAPGSHTLYAFAADGQDAPLATGPQGIPLLGELASYTFSVTDPRIVPSVSLASSANPSRLGDAVRFMATIAGSNGTPTDNVSFLDGESAISGCAGVALAAGSATCTTASLGSGDHAIQVHYAGDAAYHAASSSVMTQSVEDAPSRFTLTVTRAGDGSGTVTSSPAGIDCGATCSASFDAGTTVSLSAAAASGSIFAGWSGGGCSGTGACSVALSAATSVSATFNSGDANPPRLGNLSTRGDVLAGADVMIGGFVIGGSTPKTVVVRAIGPSLAQFGIGNALANPTLTLVRSSDQSAVATNDDWASDVRSGELSASGFAPSDSRESALYITLQPGAYTAIVSGAGGSTGVGLTEVYEVDHPEMPLINISTRGHVGSGSDVMIGGFVVTGSGPRKVVIRGIGPSLAQFGIPHPLANPKLQLVRMSDGATVATNDDWQSAANAADVTAAGFAPSDARESAILVTLEPGAYTAILTGADGGSGTALVETYAVQ